MHGLFMIYSLQMRGFLHIHHLTLTPDTLLVNMPAKIRYRLLLTTLKAPDRTQHMQEVSAFCQYLPKTSMRIKLMNK